MSSFFSARERSTADSAPSSLNRVQTLQESFFKRLSDPPVSFSSPSGKFDGGFPLRVPQPVIHLFVLMILVISVEVLLV